MGKVKAVLSYPDEMKDAVAAHGMDWWAEGGAYGSFADAIEHAREVAAERNFPIQVKCMGKSMTVYPDSIPY